MGGAQLIKEQVQFVAYSHLEEMAGRQQKDLGARPKKGRGRGRSAHVPVQSDDEASSRVKRDSEKCGKLCVGDSRCDGHSNNRKKAQKKTTGVQRTKSNSADGIDKTNPLSIKSPTKQGVKDTSTKREKNNRSSPETKEKIAQPKTNAQHSLHRSHNATAKKPPQKAKSDATCANGQNKAKVASEKKVHGKTSKEAKTKVPNLDNGAVTEPKGKVLKTVKPLRLKDVVDGKLRLKIEDIQTAAKKVNKVVDTILKSEQFNQDSLFKGIEKMSTGSYYEHVKISEPNEFDIMLKISNKSFTTINLTPMDKDNAFYTLAFKDRRPQAMEEYVNEEGNISAVKILNAFRDLIKQIISKQGMKEVSVQNKDPKSPAVTLAIKNEHQEISVDLVLALKIISKWPEQTTNGMNIDDWLGTKVKQELKKDHFYMVPKKAKYKTDTWRISFSNIEKKILTNHGNGKTCCESGGSKKEMCCRKPCLKLLKYLLELLKKLSIKKEKSKKMNQFCSYHAKTALFHCCAKNPKDEDWKLENLEACFDRYISFFQDRLREYTLYNFFIPSHNLFSGQHVGKSSCDYLYEEIQIQKLNGYPIFL